MKKVKDIFKLGEIIAIPFQENEKEENGPPIGRYLGVICFVDNKYKRIYPEPGTTWHCSVTHLNEKSIIVMPISQTDTLNAIAKVYTKPERKKKAKLVYQFESKVEQSKKSA